MAGLLSPAEAHIQSAWAITPQGALRGLEWHSTLARRAKRGQSFCSVVARASGDREPLLLRVAKGEEAERTPVWLMRQAGRYMAAFREYSTKYPFRMRSETPEIAIELSLQPWRAFHPDGVIMFSDILTPLPSLGIEFDVVSGKGPVIETPIRSIEQIKSLNSMDDPATSLPFIQEILSALRSEIQNDSTLLGFIGTPWTLAAYAMEGTANRYCLKTKTIMHRNPKVLHALLDHLTEALVTYACYQIESGAQVIQLFDSWAHHLTPHQFEVFSLPYAERVIKGVEAVHPEVPVIFHMNGGTGKLELLGDSSANVIGLDSWVDMGAARDVLSGRMIQGNVDPVVLFGTEDAIRESVSTCLAKAKGGGHILNVGNGVIQGTPEDAVALFCELAHQSSNIPAVEMMAA
ncbi:unnamed protein product [Ostreobium quekettii]|uniref:Uroporphyrinogen decarboxylase n=1 Tax=Ostreobium quekettii TaxID=121088 RepID=A0A8S1IQ14_9CHLO|nr:unnamed protein product [Ostreobium quekettii]|eukprot:evm.model.scf_1929.5 EVM.evm.TU.scf_1929.5   scf_1929:16425-21198(-)